MAKSLAQIKKDWKAAGLKWDYWVRNENDERAVLEGCKPDPAAGKRVCDFIERFCKLFKDRWAGQNVKLMQWQRDDWFMPIYSWMRPNGQRRFRKASGWMPKKNAKSASASFSAIYGLIGEGDIGAEVYCAACDRAQASIVFNEAANMVEASPELSSILTVTRSTKTITYGTNAWLKALSADAHTKEGLNASTVIVDELHAHKSRDLFTTLMYSGRARQNFLMMIISTAGDDRESIGYEEYDYAKGVLSGQITDTKTYAYICEAPIGADWKSPKVWKAANPSYGLIISQEQMQEDCREAMQSPRKVADFKRYLLNEWVDSANPWLDMNQWDACGGAATATEDLTGNPAWGGLDLSSTSDMSAFVLDVPDENNVHRLKCWFWLPEDGPWREDTKYYASYQEWVDKGFITLTPGNRIDYDYIIKTIVEQSEKYEFRSIAFDPWAASQVSSTLQEDHGLPMVEMRQGLKTMSEPCKSFEADVAAKRIQHGGNPVLRWMASNTVVKSDESDNIRMDKKNSGKKIDGIVASVMATAMARMEIGESMEVGVMLI